MYCDSGLSSGDSALVTPNLVPPLCVYASEIVSRVSYRGCICFFLLSSHSFGAPTEDRTPDLQFTREVKKSGRVERNLIVLGEELKS